MSRKSFPSRRTGMTPAQLSVGAARRREGIWVVGRQDVVFLGEIAVLSADLTMIEDNRDAGERNRGREGRFSPVEITILHMPGDQFGDFAQLESGHSRNRPRHHVIRSRQIHCKALGHTCPFFDAPVKLERQTSAAKWASSTARSTVVTVSAQKHGPLHPP